LPLSEAYRWGPAMAETFIISGGGVRLFKGALTSERLLAALD
jgi:hypothetical protein